MKYLKKFATEAEIADVPTLNVVLVADTKKVLYNVTPFGVYIQHIDGKLYTKDEWSAKAFANSEANGVAVVDSNAQFVIAKSGDYIVAWSSPADVAVDGVLLTTSSSVALTDYNGKGNTEKIISVSASGAAYKCANYSFPDGQKGYLPALGEWRCAYEKKAEIDEVMASIGGDTLGTKSYWSSTQYSATHAWYLGWEHGNRSNENKKYNVYTRAFAPLNL